MTDLERGKELVTKTRINIKKNNLEKEYEFSDIFQRIMNARFDLDLIDSSILGVALAFSPRLTCIMKIIHYL